MYAVFKALHIIFVVSYFAGIFYLVRLFVYYKDTDDFEKNKQQILRLQYAYMLKRLWNIIVVPGGILMTFFGIILIFLNPGLMLASWFHLKLMFLIALIFYHYWCWKKVRQINHLNGAMLSSSNLGLRQSNEIATFILFLVVFTVILKFQIVQYWWQLLLGFFALVMLITLTVKWVNKNKK